MAGHSKWSNIKHKKKTKDKKKNSLFNKILKDINRSIKNNKDKNKFYSLATSKNIKKSIVENIIKKKKNIESSYFTMRFNKYIEIIITCVGEKRNIEHILKSKIKNYDIKILNENTLRNFKAYKKFRIDGLYNERAIINELQQTNIYDIKNDEIFVTNNKIIFKNKKNFIHKEDIYFHPNKYYYISEKDKLTLKNILLNLRKFNFVSDFCINAEIK